MKKMRSRFISSTTSTESTRTVSEPMPKAMDSEIIQINTKLGNLRPNTSKTPKLEDGQGRTDLMRLGLNLPKDGIERTLAGRRSQ